MARTLSVYQARSGLPGATGPMTSLPPAPDGVHFVGADADAADVKTALTLSRRAEDARVARDVAEGDNVQMPITPCDMRGMSIMPPHKSRRTAHGLMNLGALAGRTGKGVNVVIVDHGLSRDYVAALGGTYGGGWVSADPRLSPPGAFNGPWRSVPGDHGNMIARNVLKIAPDATIYDAPLLPRRIAEMESFLDWAEDMYLAIAHKVVAEGGRWVIVGAWAVTDTTPEAGTGRYSNNPEHDLNRIVAFLAARADVVFAAGNNGQFAPDRRAGPYNRAPGTSILGCNGLGGVLTVGAVMPDGRWAGSSSQGPGPDRLGRGVPNEKPDLVAPSYFLEDDDAQIANTGTSAAAAVAAGIVAACRQDIGDAPDVLHARLRDAAHRDAPGWTRRMGHGIIQPV